MSCGLLHIWKHIYIYRVRSLEYRVWITAVCVFCGSHTLRSRHFVRLGKSILTDDGTRKVHMPYMLINSKFAASNRLNLGSDLHWRVHIQTPIHCGAESKHLISWTKQGAILEYVHIMHDVLLTTNSHNYSVYIYWGHRKRWDLYQGDFMHII